LALSYQTALHAGLTITGWSFYLLCARRIISFLVGNPQTLVSPLSAKVVIGTRLLLFGFGYTGVTGASDCVRLIYHGPPGSHVSRNASTQKQIRRFVSRRKRSPKHDWPYFLQEWGKYCWNVNARRIRRQESRDVASRRIAPRLDADRREVGRPLRTRRARPSTAHASCWPIQRALTYFITHRLRSRLKYQPNHTLTSPPCGLKIRRP
jgi:hypothetical protein